MKFTTLSLFLIALLPAGAWAETCSFRQSCGGGMGSYTHRFSSRSACKSKLASTRSAINSRGGGCSFSSCSCTGSSSGGSSGAGSRRSSNYSGLSTNQMVGQMVGEALGQALAGALVGALFGGSSRNDAYAEHQAELAAQRRRVAECEGRKAQTAAFELDKADALSQMKGADDDGLGWKLEGDGMGIASMSFKTYDRDETIRREVLEGIRGDKELHGWCVLHAPLRPTAPTHDGLDCDYEIRLERYYSRRNNWEAKCEPERGDSGGGGGGLAFKTMEDETVPEQPAVPMELPLELAFKTMESVVPEPDLKAKAPLLRKDTGGPSAAEWAESQKLNKRIRELDAKAPRRTAAEHEELKQLDRRAAVIWKKALNNPDWTQREREQWRLRMRVDLTAETRMDSAVLAGVRRAAAAKGAPYDPTRARSWGKYEDVPEGFDNDDFAARELNKAFMEPDMQKKIQQALREDYEYEEFVIETFNKYYETKFAEDMLNVEWTEGP